MNRTRFARVGVVVLVVGVGLWATARPGGEFSGLEDRLAAAADEVGRGGHINLGDATEFEWDEAHIFGGYTSAAEVEEEMDGWSPLSPAERLVLGDLFLPNDSVQLVAFSQGGEVVAWTVLNHEQRTQTLIHFHSGVLPRVAVPADEFAVQQDGDGWALVPAGLAEDI